MTKKVLIFSHHPLFPESGYEALNNRELLGVIEKYASVKALIAGIIIKEAMRSISIFRPLP